MEVNDDTIFFIDSRPYKLVPLEETKSYNASGLPQSYEDCFLKIMPKWYITTNNQISDVHSEIRYEECFKNNVPSQKCAEQLQAAAKLFVVQHALNGGEWVPEDGKVRYFVGLSEGNLSVRVEFNYMIFNPYPFKNHEGASHALKIAEPIWKQYFGV